MKGVNEKREKKEYGTLVIETKRVRVINYLFQTHILDYRRYIHLKPSRRFFFSKGDVLPPPKMGLL